MPENDIFKLEQRFGWWGAVIAGPAILALPSASLLLFGSRDKRAAAVMLILTEIALLSNWSSSSSSGHSVTEAYSNTGQYSVAHITVTPAIWFNRGT